MIAAAIPLVPDLRNEPSSIPNATFYKNKTAYCAVEKDITIFCDEATRFKLTYIAIISMAWSQMPAIALGVFGVMRAFMNHGASAMAIMDCLRSGRNNLNEKD